MKEDLHGAPHFSPSPEKIREILQSLETIAIVGLSHKVERDSNRVARYLMVHGYEIVPVNPGQREILGRPCYKSLSHIPYPVDVADLFLNPSRVMPVVEEAIEKGIKIIWMQLGVIHHEAAAKAGQAGITVIMDRCIKQEHERLGLRPT
ncbi:MAG: CoA-binding protein [Deltaproteobacteria bacterium]|nr:CoA-binding protein [Deltaproteobacteria bacterium]MBW2137346.1 CoA-binding protein [Deltaproteobacteria bacterium]